MTDRLCECGCGEPLTGADRRERPPQRFVVGHQSRLRCVPLKVYPPSDIPAGLCQCGCGESTPIAAGTDRRRGWIKGQPIRFVDGHNKRGKGSHFWKGGRSLYKSLGSSVVRELGISREHELVVYRAMGRPLPKGAEIHHVNEDKWDNRPENLVVCQDHAYHKLLHLRRDALRASGNPNYRRCWICKTWDDLANMMTRKHAGSIHRLCQTERGRRRRAA